MRTLTLSTGSFDRDNTFKVDVGRAYPRKCSLMRDYKTRGDGILWIMQHAGVIASQYSTAEILERERLAAEKPIVDGEVVLVDGKRYVVHVTGDYSDCGTLEAV